MFDHPAMAVIHYRFRSQKLASAVPIDGRSISLADFKRFILQAHRLADALDYDLSVADAQTNKEYEDEAEQIPAGSCLLLRRVPLPTRKMKGKLWFEREIPPPGYVCKRCNISGHYIKDCKTNGDPDFEPKRLKAPRGIPRSMLVENPHGAYALSTGAAAVVQPDEAAFEKEMEGLPSTRPAIVVPQEWICPFCKKAMTDAVLASKCCFRSYCDKCIRDYMIAKSVCICGAQNTVADDLIPNRTLREAISRIYESRTSSSGSSGMTSSTFSASSTCEPEKCSSSDLKKGEAATKGQPLRIVLRKRNTTDTVSSETILESVVAKEPILSVSAPAHESKQGQQKKRKTAHPPFLLSAASNTHQRAYHQCQPSVYGCFRGSRMPHTMPYVAYT